MKTGQTIIYTDGACLGNPGPGGWAAIVGVPGANLKELGAFENATTNNRMELLAVIEALEFVIKEFDNFCRPEIIVLSDSSYVIQGASKWIYGWKRRGWKGAESGEEIKNVDMWMKLDDVLSRLSKKVKIDWRHIEGHKGIAGNERCDLISTTLARRESIELYEGPTHSYLFEYQAVPNRLPSVSKDKSAVYYLSLINGELFRDMTWAECEARVRGKRGVKYKKCHSREEEIQILKDWGFLKSST